MSAEEEIEHLLDAKEFLRNEDSSGYAQLLDPSLTSVQPSQPKRRRCSPWAANHVSLPDCRNGPFCGGGPLASGTTIEDANGGSVVCFQCGLIQATSIFEPATTDALHHDGVGRVVVHRYSRIVHWAANMKSLQGETGVTLTEEQWAILRAYLKDEESHIGTGVFAVREALRRKIIPYRFLRHATTIAWLVWSDQAKPPVIKSDEFRCILRRLREYESVWDSEISGKTLYKRKNFPTFRFMFPFVTSDLGLDHLCALVQPHTVKRSLKKMNWVVGVMRILIQNKK